MTKSREDTSPMEEVVLACFEQDDVEAAVAAACEEHPEHATTIRRVAARLRKFGMGVPEVAAGPLERLGPFEFREQLGEGGMGVVYRAWQEPPGREVALKIIRPQLMHFDGSRARFAREIEASLKLSHPGIVPVYEVGTTEGVPWFSMAFVRGRSLAAAIAAHRERDAKSLTASDVGPAFQGETWWRAVVDVIRQVALALQHAHDRGVLHRDVKPSNVMLADDGRAMLLDFGLARTDGSQQLTQSNAMLGSLPYMPPEFLRGDPRDADVESDVYSLGVTLYEALSLHSPFLGPTAEVTRRNVLEASPDRLRDHNASIPRALETVCATAMAELPNRRYATMRDFAADLQNVALGRPIAASPDNWLDHAARYVRHNRVFVTATAIVVATLAVGVAASLWLFFDAERERAAAELRSYVANVASAESSIRSHRIADAVERLRAAPGEWRGWEWRHLVARLDLSDEQPLFAAAGGLTRLAVARSRPDAEPTRIAFFDGVKIVVLDMDSGEPHRTIPASRVDALALASHGDFLAWSDGEFVRRAALDGREGWRRELPGCGALAFDPTGHELATAQRNGRLAFWAAESGESETWINVRGSLLSVSYSGDGKLVACGSSSQAVHVFDRETRARRHLLRGHYAMVVALAFDSDGERLASASADGRVMLWDLERGSRLGFPLALDAAITGVVFPNDREVAIAAGESVVRWSVRNGLVLGTLHGHRGRVTGLTWTARSRLLTIGADGLVRGWDASAVDVPRIGSHGTRVDDVAISPDGRWVASGAADGRTRIFDVDKQRIEVDGLAYGINGANVVTFDPSGSRVAFVRGDRITVLRVGERTLEVDLRDDYDSLRAAAFSPSGAHFAVAGDREVALYETRGWNPVARAGLEHPARALVFASDDSLLVASDGGVVRRDVPALDARGTLTDRPARAVAVSPGGAIAVGGLDGYAVRAGADAAFVHALAGVEVFDLAFEPDGDRLFVATADGAIHVQRGAIGLARLHSADSTVRALAVSGDGTRLVSGDQLGELRIWTAPRTVDLGR